MENEMIRYVQPIIVPKSNKSEYDTAIAVAMASYWDEEDYINHSNWMHWLSDAYGKSVRRASDATFEKLVSYIEHPEDHDVDDFYKRGKIYKYYEDYAISYEPITYDDMPKLIRKCQVSGTEFDASKKFVLPSIDTLDDISSPIIVVNDSLGMSSGKIAAQVAHGYWGYRKLIKDTREPTLYYAKDSVFVSLRSRAKCIIMDSGLTELEGKNETILVL